VRDVLLPFFYQLLTIYVFPSLYLNYFVLSLCDILVVLEIVHGGPEKIAQNLMQHHFATICSRITWFSSKCSDINCQHEEWANFEYCD